MTHTALRPALLGTPTTPELLLHMALHALHRPTPTSVAQPMALSVAQTSLRSGGTAPHDNKCPERLCRYIRAVITGDCYTTLNIMRATDLPLLKPCIGTGRSFSLVPLWSLLCKAVHAELRVDCTWQVSCRRTGKPQLTHRPKATPTSAANISA